MHNRSLVPFLHLADPSPSLPPRITPRPPFLLNKLLCTSGDQTRGTTHAQSLLTKLKILMTSFDSLPPMGGEGPDAEQERKLARDVMEVAVFLSARDGDSDAFQRHMAQV